MYSFNLAGIGVGWALTERGEQRGGGGVSGVRRGVGGGRAQRARRAPARQVPLEHHPLEHRLHTHATLVYKQAIQTYMLIYGLLFK